MTVKIKGIKPKPFTTSEGDQIEYFWYTAEIIGGDKSGVTIQFGSKVGGREKGDILDLILDKIEFSNGKIGYKEVSVI